ncbi:hypothetical protein [Propionigenium maris]|nr:hypothetical protein [Propionigenium maris]
MRSLVWYGRRFFKYYIQNPGYRVVYGSFSNYCRCRKKYEEGGK